MKQALHALALVTILFMVAAATAQKAPLPTTYRLTETNGFFGDPVKLEVARTGQLGYMKHFKPGTSLVSSISVINMATSQEVTWDPATKPADCIVSKFSGSWGDPFEDGITMLDQLNSMHPKQVGTAQLLGITVNVLEAQGPPSMGLIKAWVDAKTGAPLKMTSTLPGAATKILSEINTLSLVAPPDALFKIPAACTAAASAPPPPTADDNEIAKLTNDDPHNYVRAVFSADSNDSCSVIYKVVQAGTMQPVPPTFSVQVDIGGTMHKLVSPTHNGVYRIPNIPPNFNIETSFGNVAGDSYALIHRQCFGPETVLLYVIKNPSDVVTEGGDYYWVKSGKYAATANTE